MSRVFAVLTSDPNLMGCELGRLAVALEVLEGPLGLGTFTEAGPLLERLPGVPARARLTPAYGSPALLLHVGPPVDAEPEDGQPLRARNWLFSLSGRVADGARVRAALLARLPEQLARGVHGQTTAEVVFSLFLQQLRATHHAEDGSLEARLAGAALLTTVRALDAAAAEAGAPRAPDLDAVATNGEVLLAVRWGDAPLRYTRLEGTDTCEVCGLDPLARPGPLAAHRRRRAVAVASHLARASVPGWVELAHGEGIAVGPDAQVHALR